MIRKIRIENYKSIPLIDLDLGRVTVLIGANGCGKSNILEAITLAAAAAQGKLDNEFLIARGIRVTETRFMRSAFVNLPAPSQAVGFTLMVEPPLIDPIVTSRESIKLSVEGDNKTRFACELIADETTSYPRWKQLSAFQEEDLHTIITTGKFDLKDEFTQELLHRLNSELAKLSQARATRILPEFLVYAPENSALRTFQAEGQILPLGIRGEGLFAHLKGLDTTTHSARLQKIRENMKLIDWFENFVIPENLSPGERTIKIQDHYLSEGTLLDQRSANEGFLFLLFYMTVLISPETPSFFSIDNIDASLNPKLCIALMQQLLKLANEYDKQVILTTHSPAVLDALDLDDEQQRLLVVDRNKNGYTRIRRIDPPKPSAGQSPVCLSEAFMRGYLGGLPKNF